jgi:hypothetical protein
MSITTNRVIETSAFIHASVQQVWLLLLLLLYVPGFKPL